MFEVWRAHMLDSVIRQRRLGAVNWLLVTFGAAVAVWASAGCDGGENGVVPEAGSNGAQQTVQVDAEQDAVRQELETVGTEAVSRQSEPQSDGAESASGASNGAATGAVSRQDPSMGPILQWTEFDPGIERGHLLVSTGDGRVVIGGTTSAGERRFMITSDGSHWEALQLPDGV